MMHDKTLGQGLRAHASMGPVGGAWSCCLSWSSLWSSAFSFSESLDVGCLIGIWLAEYEAF